MSAGMATGKVSAWDRLMVLQPVAPILVMIFFIISIAVTTFPKTSVNLVAWGFTGLIGVIFLRTAFPRSFGYGLWLLAIYILTGAGMFMLNGFLLSGGQGLAIGILLELIAGYVVYQLILEIKGIRDVAEGPYIPLGIFSLAVAMFFILSMGAFGGLAGWVRSGGDLYIYLASEVLLTLVTIVIFSKMEICVLYMEEGPKAARRRVSEPTMAIPEATDKVIRTAKTVVTKTKKAITPGRSKVKSSEPCPICGSELRIVSRSCPSCGETETTAVCKRSSHVFLPCPSCGRANFQGEYRCKGCNAKLSETLLCRKCGKESDLVEWSTFSQEKKEGTERSEPA